MVTLGLYPILVGRRGVATASRRADPRSPGEAVTEVWVRPYGVSANTRSAWSIANARRIVGYEPRDDSKVVYADEIRDLMLEPARQIMVQGDARGGRRSRPS
jgi:hypothetical protein